MSNNLNILMPDAVASYLTGTDEKPSVFGLNAFMKPIKSLVGLTFGRLTVISLIVDKRKGKELYYKCKCVCGKTKEIRATSLRKGRTNSCGCLRNEVVRKKMLKHGNSCGDDNKPTPEYNLWLNIKNRCHCPNNKSFPYYGGRGIVMCDQWRTSFSTFLKDIGLRPSIRHSLDRFPDNNGNYEPNNVRWATRLEQGKNMRNNVTIAYKGSDILVSQFAKIFNVWQSQVNYFIKKGVSPDKIAFHFENLKSKNK